MEEGGSSEGSGQGLSRVRELKNYKKCEKGALVHVKPVWACLLVLIPYHLWKLGSYPPTEAGSQGALSSDWLEQIVNSLAGLSFLRQTL